MKPTAFFSVLFVLFTFLGCQKDTEPEILPEHGYPTTYKPLSKSEWDALNSDFQKINIHEGLALNEYGFVKGKIPLNENDSLSKDFVIAWYENLLNRYQKFFGIPENITFDFENEILVNVSYINPYGTVPIYDFYYNLNFFENEFPEEFNSDEIEFKFFLRQSRFDGELFQGSDLYFDFKKEEGFIEISGNWFPEVITPEIPIFTESNAISSAYWKILEETGIDLWESKHQFTIYKTLIRNYTDNSIEIRQCWCVNAQANEELFCYVYIDTQTGEIIKYYSRGWIYL